MQALNALSQRGGVQLKREEESSAGGPPWSVRLVFGAHSATGGPSAKKRDALHQAAERLVAILEERGVSASILEAFEERKRRQQSATAGDPQGVATHLWMLAQHRQGTHRIRVVAERDHGHPGLRRFLGSAGVFGVDLEGTHRGGDVALLVQISSGEETWLVRCRGGVYPAELLSFFGDPSRTKAVFGGGDEAMMGAALAVVDVQQGAMRCGGRWWGDKAYPSLVDAANHFGVGGDAGVGVRWCKHKALSTSEWGVSADLRREQIGYAAWDAWAALRLHRALQHPGGF